MNIKFALSAAGLLGLTLSCLGSPLTPGEAMRRVSDYTSSTPLLKKRIPAENAMTPVYTAKAEGMDDNAFYVFNTAEGGFIIVSADDRLPAVLGFSNNGAFSEDRISPDMKWWLGQYSRDIANLYISEGVDVPVDESVQKRAAIVDRKSIEPMLKTRWDQMAPYNLFTPRQYPTGCVATAMAQVMKYHEWPEMAVGSHGDEIFEGTFYDWENMLDVYQNNRYTTEQAEAVATLMRQCGAAVDMQYSPWSSGAYSFNVPIALYTYFGYNEGMKLEFRDYHKMSEWNDMVYAELEANRPVYYSGASSYGGHAFVCDGYLSNNYFHFNWGWSGYQDGYYLLNALNPGVGGTGSFAGGYNAQQTIITGLGKPEGISRKQVALLSTGSFIYKSDGKFGVDSDPEGYNAFYNPLGYVVSGTLGLKVTPMSGGDPKYFSGSSFSLQSLYMIRDFSCSVSGLPDGKYKVEPAFSKDGVWYPVQVMVGTQTYVTLTVNSGKYAYSNEGVPDEEKPHLLAGLPRTMPTIYADGAKIFRATIVNVSGGDYNNELTLSLYEEGKGGAGTVRETTNFVTVPGNSALDVDFVIERSNPAGAYELYLMDYRGDYLVTNRNGNLISDNVITTVNSGREISEDAKMAFSGISPNFWSLDQGNIGLMMTAKNNYFAQVTQEFYVKLLEDATFKEFHTFGPFSITLDSNSETIVNFQSTDMNLQAGNYYWQVVDRNGQRLSQLYPLMITGETKSSNGIYYQITSEKDKTARLVSSVEGEYKGSVAVPESVNGYVINDMRSDAFTFATELSALSLPSGISRIDNGAFYNATGLRNLAIMRENPPLLYPEAFSPGAEGNVVLNTVSGVINRYAHSPIWEDFIYSNWNISTAEGVTLSTEGLEKDPLTGSFYNPYYVAAGHGLALTCISDDPDMGFRAEINIEGTESSQDFWRTAWLPVINGMSASVHIVQVPGLKVDEIEDTGIELTVIRPDGVTVLKNGTRDQLTALPSGLYIVNGKKVIVR